MSMVVFIGPTLPIAEARRELDAEFLPPVAQGDVYRVARRRPRAIGIVDGYFDRVPSVWHKEILWAMSQGIHVFGAASMGALRAAELASFGMIGVGHVFKAFNDGELEDDDEVAVVHAPREAGYRPLSVAMVDIRATVKSAVDAGVVTQDTARQLLTTAKEMPYAERDYRLLLGRARAAGLVEVDAFEDFLGTGRVDRKRRDAISLLRVMKAFMVEDLPPHRADFSFAHTDAFEEACNRVNFVTTAPLNGMEDSGLLNELYLSGEWPHARDAALLRLLILNGPGAHLLASVDPKRAEEEFRIAHELTGTDEFAAWCAEQELSPERLSRFFVEESVLRTVTLAYGREIASELPAHLRGSGRWPALTARAKLKAACRPASLVESGLEEEALFAWYFREVLRRSPPRSIQHFASEAGFADVAAFRRAVLLELGFRQGTSAGAVAHGEPVG